VCGLKTYYCEALRDTTVMEEKTREAQGGGLLDRLKAAANSPPPPLGGRVSSRREAGRRWAIGEGGNDARQAISVKVDGDGLPSIVASLDRCRALLPP
jgi:hypothetical protein